MIEDCETWREMYERCYKEKEDKFKLLTFKAKQSYKELKFASAHTKVYCNDIKPKNLVEEERLDKARKDKKEAWNQFQEQSSRTRRKLKALGNVPIVHIKKRLGTNFKSNHLEQGES